MLRSAASLSAAQTGATLLVRVTNLTGHKLIVVVCDNGGFAVIDRLQVFKGGASFNNLWETSHIKHQVRVDFVKHAEAMGAIGESVSSIADLEQAFERARKSAATSSSVTAMSAQFSR